VNLEEIIMDENTITVETSTIEAGADADDIITDDNSQETLDSPAVAAPAADSSVIDYNTLTVSNDSELDFESYMDIDAFPNFGTDLLKYGLLTGFGFASILILSFYAISKATRLLHINN
jgi:hypothetical protein